VPILAARNFGKTFAGRTVLRKMDLDIFPGEVHGLVGQNGSGKSTFVKILSGFHPPDPGASLLVRGHPVQLPLSESDPAKLGMSFVHQDLPLFEAGSILENLLVGRYETGFGWRISWRRERRRVRELLKGFNLDLDPDTPVSSLADVERVMIAVIRALDRITGGGEGVLVLDEPTSYLPRDAVERLFATIRRIARLSFGVLLVTHRLEEILAITDRVTILRDGRVVGSLPTPELTQRDLVSRILGFSLEQLYPTPHESASEVVLAVENLAGSGVNDCSFEVRRGEILGLTGLLGMGQESVPYLLFGAERAAAGTLSIGGRRDDLRGMTPDRAIHAGLALLPANRLRDGGVGSASLVENITLPTLDRYVSAGILRHRREVNAVRRMLTDFEIQPAAPESEFATFSGGNQQKALVARWFATHPEALLLHEPTIGVDIGARRQIFRHIRDAAQRGTAILVASVEYEDLAHLCDRVLVFRHGRVVSELSGNELTVERILEQSSLDDPGAPAATVSSDGSTVGQSA
jgi:ribose transport system ATP-binding protein